eukprot:8849201-Karenia_brevis.AAC.1
MGEEIEALGQIPTGMDQAQQLSSPYANWLGPQMRKIRYGQELAQMMVDRQHLVHPAGGPPLGPGGARDGSQNINERSISSI